MIRRETRQFNLSVEGINCETKYFEHLAKLVNAHESSAYNLKVYTKVANPYDFAKRRAYMPRERKRGSRNSPLPYIHIQDVEDFKDAKQRDKFIDLLRNMRKAEKEFGVEYLLGYSNYTFELWMLLHVADMNYPLKNRYAYLDPINRWFGKRYKRLDEYKRKDEFQSILNQYVTIDSVFSAITRAEAIERENKRNGAKRFDLLGHGIFQENPATSVHEVVQLMLDTCDVTGESGVPTGSRL